MERRIRFYPQARESLIRTLLADLVVIALLAVFGWLALEVHDTVEELRVLGRGVNQAGTAVQGGFDSAAEGVDDLPVIGDEIAGALMGAGAGSGGNVAELGRQGEEGVSDLADLLGLVVFLVPALVVLAIALPARVRQIRRLTAADRLLAGPTGI